MPDAVSWTEVRIIPPLYSLAVGIGEAAKPKTSQDQAVLEKRGRRQALQSMFWARGPEGGGRCGRFVG